MFFSCYRFYKPGYFRFFTNRNPDNSLRALSEREANNYLITKAPAIEWAKLNGYPVTAQVGETGTGYPADEPYDCIEQKGVAKNVLRVGTVEDIKGEYTT